MVRLTRMLAAVLLLGSSAASAQSLVEIAKAEEARRKTVEKPSKVYTNNDLKPDLTRPPAPAPAAALPEGAAKPASAPTTATTTTPTGAAPSSPGAASATPGVRDEAYWKGLMTNARDALERSRMFLDALQSRINALTTDFVNRDDPYQRATIEQDRTKALAELERVKKDIEDQTKAIAAIEEEARKAGVPSGWLR